MFTVVVNNDPRNTHVLSAPNRFRNLVGRLTRLMTVMVLNYLNRVARRALSGTCVVMYKEFTSLMTVLRFLRGLRVFFTQRLWPMVVRVPRPSRPLLGRF